MSSKSALRPYHYT